MYRRIHRGFTLIELMVVIVIVGILAAIAYPSYRERILKSRRSDAMSTLMECAADQERWYADHNSYDTGTNVCNSGTSQQGYYTVAVSNSNCSQTINGTTYYSCFKITATAGSKGGQNQDTSCATMSIDQTGKKTSNGGTGDTNDCWGS